MPPPRAGRAAIVGCVLAATAMVAAEATIVATAMPTIVAELGGGALYAWAFSAFALTQTALTVVFGKLADVLGRRPVMLGGLIVFVAGSALAGAAATMPALILGRLVQGVGAGSILPVSITLVADLYPVRERARVQSLLASVWAVAAVIGPVAGAWIMAVASWRWMFWVNLPVGGLTAIAFALLLGRDPPRARAPIDYAGALLFLLAIACLMVALTDPRAAELPRIAASAAGCALFARGFVVRERRAADPIVDFALVRHPVIAAANGTALVTGMVLMGATTFLPMYVQGVLGRSPVAAGLTLTMMMLGWPIGATVASRLIARAGLRRLLVAGSLLVPAGAALIAAVRPGVSPLLPAAGSLVAGLGMGFASVSAMILVQESVPPDRRASATASNLFARNLGSTLGAALLGAVQTIAAGAGAGLAGSLHLVFAALFGVACLSFLAARRVPAGEGAASQLAAEPRVE